MDLSILYIMLVYYEVCRNPLGIVNEALGNLQVEPVHSLHWEITAFRPLESIPRLNVRSCRSGVGQHNRNVTLYLFVDCGRVLVELPRFQSLKSTVSGF